MPVYDLLCVRLFHSSVRLCHRACGFSFSTPFDYPLRDGATFVVLMSEKSKIAILRRALQNVLLQPSSTTALPILPLLQLIAEYAVGTCHAPRRRGREGGREIVDD